MTQTCPVQISADEYRVCNEDHAEEVYAIEDDASAIDLLKARAEAMADAGYSVTIHTEDGEHGQLTVLTVAFDGMMPTPWPPMKPSGEVYVYEGCDGEAVLAEERSPTSSEVGKRSNPLDRVEPTNVTNYNRTLAELEMFFMFAMVVQGKNSDDQSPKLEAFLEPAVGMTPFEYIRHLNTIGPRHVTAITKSVTDKNGVVTKVPTGADRTEEYSHALYRAIQDSHLGQWERFSEAFTIASTPPFDIRTCSKDNLEAIPGCSFKTSRFFLLHSRWGVIYAALDTHILKWMIKRGLYPARIGADGKKLPPQTPTNEAKYLATERVFLDEFKRRYPKGTQKRLAKWDVTIWSKTRAALAAEKAKRSAAAQQRRDEYAAGVLQRKAEREARAAAKVKK